ncbi:MAG: type II toxin-antitoxin system RelE/ParE family toxin [Microcystis sp. M53603_WE2]|uniref:type II toxin-antitoxin system RelE/ParE family toxin n=1 Tax=Microcystis sp. M53603_WE2 TaxID=3030678 RepID=UPI0022BDC6AB|nr:MULTISPECIES: type II toxin-antitoxin system RelE/ParE family toxin [unclassified Microcystis]MCZ8025054.1 type II toxin-antitoxin system RelE/ParE family toxin [Microcystis sp. LE19-10.1B]MDJ0523791.1 type II toxin-antitoxin system RelE/ParE family toxin [Microcystis sp. M53600_WE12]MDJ0537818.1 type II toxin-antitoxin system RelE/ParE family toxin [Microcystis sp. M53603_WE2]MDJ0607171.1 type II toxin-antitoxin system RelE/ParE family toxin [Microcystis sp. M53602_WE12]
MSIVFALERTNQLSLLPDKDLVDLCPPIEPYQVTKNQDIFSPSARLDLKQVNSYLAGKNPQAARILKEKIQQACKKLAKFPNLGRRRDELIPSLRSFPVEDYLIFYFPLENGIEIARVVNGYRDLDAMFDVD